MYLSCERPASFVIHTLQQDCSSLLHWFNENQIKVNPQKFQALSFGKRGNGVIICEDSVVLLDIAIDLNYANI